MLKRKKCHSVRHQSRFEQFPTCSVKKQLPVGRIGHFWPVALSHCAGKQPSVRSSICDAAPLTFHSVAWHSWHSVEERVTDGSGHAYLLTSQAEFNTNLSILHLTSIWFLPSVITDCICVQSFKTPRHNHRLDTNQLFRGLFITRTVVMNNASGVMTTGCSTSGPDRNTGQNH